MKKPPHFEAAVFASDAFYVVCQKSLAKDRTGLSDFEREKPAFFFD